MNKGKQFESKFAEDWEKSFPGSFCLRVPDQQSGYYGTSRNICDFICFAENHLFLIECKTIKGNTFPLSNFTQYDKMSSVLNYPNVISGIVIWYYEKDVVLFVPLDTYKKMLENNEKSINVRAFSIEKSQNIIDKYKECGYNILEIPSKKKRVFMDSNYKILLEE